MSDKSKKQLSVKELTEKFRKNKQLHLSGGKKPQINIVIDKQKLNSKSGLPKLDNLNENSSLQSLPTPLVKNDLAVLEFAYLSNDLVSTPDVDKSEKIKQPLKLNL